MTFGLGPVHGRSMLGYLRTLRIMMFSLPIASLILLMMPGRRFNGAYINPESLGQAQPYVAPFLLGAALLAVVAAMLKPESPKGLRMLMIVLSYFATLAAFMLAVIYSLAGASWGWTIAGFALALATRRLVSLARLAPDASPRWYGS